MPFYHKVGDIPKVKHTTFHKKDGKSLFREELISTIGFSGVYSNLYHHNLPTTLLNQTQITNPDAGPWEDAPLNYLHFSTDSSKRGGDFISSRMAYLYNAQCRIACAHVTEPTDRFYRNAWAYEYIFVHRGKGELHSPYGKNVFGPGDQIIIPKATTYSFHFDDYEDNKLLIVESPTPFDIPAHFRNSYGQMEEHAPYCERDFRPPEFMEPNLEEGAFQVIVKVGDRMFEHTTRHHPYDVVGWDGYLYPYCFNIDDYHAKVGRIHLPPPVHLAFTTAHLVICNFVPRPYDFHEAAIPAPYFHSNVDSDEVLYYVKGNFMSRKGISEGSITLHPGGMPHGPQPGRTEDSVGATWTDECAVMIDTFAPLQLTANIQDALDKDYPQSWLK